MDLLEKSRNTLELPAVLALLAAEAVSEPAKAEALALVPSAHRGEVERLLAETTDAKDMMVYKGSPSLSGLRDVRGSLARADMGGVLNTRELLEIAGVLQSARAVRSYGMSAEKETCIDHLFKMLQTNRFLEDKIVNSIPGEDEIADSASSELSDIRRKMRAAAARVRDSLQKIISAPSMAKFLQDPIITTRSDRYVVPVKAECKGSVPGLVHDVSASGATLFVEPMAAVKANNEIRELKAKEKAEIERILAELSAALHAEGKTLYAAVMPAVYGDAYFDGYDFKTLGTLCDRVILMAHDYAASDLTGFLGSRYYRNHPCAPLYKVYYAVRTAAREMDDPAKLTLAVSMDARAWQTDADGLLTAVRSTHPLQTTVYKRLCQSDTVMGWSDTARSPWCTYTTESGQHIFLWYEDARSTAEKLSCAKLVGVTSVSVWRLGLIPDYADEGLHYDVMSVL